MGLIKAAVGAISSTLKDQWKDAIRCEEMTNDILMVKKTTPTGVISNGSIIVVAPGQCAIIIDNGKVIDATAEEGTYTFDTSSTPSFFVDGIKAITKESLERLTYGGEISKQQAVYFFNIKEIVDNKFGTPAPIPFQDWSHPIPNQMTGTLIPLRVEVKCFGKYTFKIENPAVFMNEISGVSNVYRKTELTEQIRSEVISAFQNVLNELGNSQHKVPVLELPSQTDEIKEIMDKNIFDEPIRRRGISLVGFAVESVTLDEESEKKIDQYELSSNQFMQQGTLTGAYANAVQDAAKNSSGAMNGFMGIGMMNMASNGVVGGTANGPWQNAQNQVVANQQTENTNIMDNAPQVNSVTTVEEKMNTSNEWVCECGTKNTGKFCSNCGKKHEINKICPKCGTVNEITSKFCNECGEKLQ